VLDDVDGSVIYDNFSGIAWKGSKYWLEGSELCRWPGQIDKLAKEYLITLSECRHNLLYRNSTATYFFKHSCQSPATTRFL
jgi:hypothetical protein